MHRDRIIELCMPYDTLLPPVHVSGHKELCPTCWCAVAWAVAPPVGVVRPGLWPHLLVCCGLGCGPTCWCGAAWAVAAEVFGQNTNRHFSTVDATRPLLISPSSAWACVLLNTVSTIRFYRAGSPIGHLCTVSCGSNSDPVQ